MEAVATKEITVTLGVGGASYQKTLAASLLREGMLRRVLSPGPYLEIQDPEPDGSLQTVKRFPVSQFVNRVAWGLWRRIPARVRPRQPVLVTVRLADRAWSSWIPRCTVFHGWIGYSLACLGAAKRQGAATLLENPGRHPRLWRQSNVEECERFGIRPPDQSIALTSPQVRRMEREFEICDRIAVPSTLSYQSFVECGLGEKAVIVPTGVDTDFFAPPPRPREERLFRVCFVGRVELTKGIGYLLQAWKRLALPNAELVLVGDVKSEMKSLFKTYADSTVRTTGIVLPQQVADTYRGSDLFVLPSVSEGLAQVLLEAMSSGLPVVASNMSGANDCVTNGKEGLIVPVRNIDRLCDAILWCYQHREEARAMGEAARNRILGNFTLQHYNARQIDLYRSLAA
jgi:starch synthase